MDTTIAVKRFVVDEFAPDIDADELDIDYDLLEAGILDSLGLLIVLAWIEERFGLTIDAGEIGEDDFRSVSSICSLIESTPAPQGKPG